MKQQAVKKIREEIEAETDEMTKLFGQQVIDIIESTNDFGQVLQEDKTLKACKKTMDDYAWEHKKGNRSCVAPKQAEDIIKTYYGINKTKESRSVIDIMDLL
ncbi:hypothetical protein NE619_13235 [Anaerovorax odorimutans]|uniref:Uncharacterized protein n=1 Tax=Anaerovorax odorimutans TaxID=109327 RepID=A0ABT1RS39_9FIRM|nr:hypothetical protein [Anaerovorax odorimutans]MCQ4637691.1 hypothetical protein [Anaerovorax odorimutans]